MRQTNHPPLWRRVTNQLPGLALAVLLTIAALGLERIEFILAGAAWIDALVLAIFLGALFHTFIGLRPCFIAGVSFAAKTLLEISIVLLGASLTVETLARSGLSLAFAVVAVVIASLIASYTIGRLLGLPRQLAMLVACGNAICGNSAIIAVAPVIGARPAHVAAAISFTAALGIVVVLLLPLAFPLFGIDAWHYGLFAGLTVYAVPQVLAATVPVSAISAQVGAVVKLMRVLMLGPVIVMLGIWSRGGDCEPVADNRPRFWRMVPWFIIGFLIMMAARSTGLIPRAALGTIHDTSTRLTIISMAALGLSTDLRTLGSAGSRVLMAGVLSLIVLAGLAAAVVAYTSP